MEPCLRSQFSMRYDTASSRNLVFFFFNLFSSSLFLNTTQNKSVPFFYMLYAPLRKKKIASWKVNSQDLENSHKYQYTLVVSLNVLINNADFTKTELLA